MFIAYSVIETLNFIRLPFLAPQFLTGFTSPEMHHEIHSPQPAYPKYPSTSPSPNMNNPTDSRRLPPSTTSFPPLGERWSQVSYVPLATGHCDNNIRSPTATYPNQNHFMQHNHVSMNTQSHSAIFEDLPRLDHASCSHAQPRSAPNKLTQIVSDLQQLDKNPNNPIQSR